MLVVALVSGGLWTPLVTGAETSSGPNLEPVWVSVSPSEPVEGEEITLYANVTNSGNETAQTFEIALELHDPNSSAHEPLANRTVESLEPGEHATVRYDGLTLPEGDYEVRAIADRADDVNETDETDNVQRELFTVQASQASANLEAQLQLHDREVAVGDRLPVSYGVTNDGDGDAGSFTIEAYLDGDLIHRNHLDSLSAHMGVGWFDEVGPFEEPGRHDLVLVVDAGDTVQETNERDNRDVERFEVVVPPDPAVTALDVTKDRLRTDAATGPANPVAGQEVAVTIENVGEGEIEHQHAFLTVEACPDEASLFTPFTATRCDRLGQWLLDPHELGHGATVETDWDTTGKAGDWTICASLDVEGTQSDPTNDERCRDTFVLAGGTGLGGLDVRR